LSTKANWTLDTTTSTASRATRFVYPLSSGLCLVLLSGDNTRHC
jgi:hypothetical protein